MAPEPVPPKGDEGERDDVAENRRDLLRRLRQEGVVPAIWTDPSDALDEEKARAEANRRQQIDALLEEKRMHRERGKEIDEQIAALWKREPG